MINDNVHIKFYSSLTFNSPITAPNNLYLLMRMHALLNHPSWPSNVGAKSLLSAFIEVFYVFSPSPTSRRPNEPVPFKCPHISATNCLDSIIDPCVGNIYAARHVWLHRLLIGYYNPPRMAASNIYKIEDHRNLEYYNLDHSLFQVGLELSVLYRNSFVNLVNLVNLPINLVNLIINFVNPCQNILINLREPINLPVNLVSLARQPSSTFVNLLVELHGPTDRLHNQQVFLCLLPLCLFHCLRFHLSSFCRI
jgi:hypothetical protein